MKKTIGAAAILASVTFGMNAHADGKKHHIPGTLGNGATGVACEREDLPGCVVAATSYTESLADGEQVTYTYCPNGEKPVTGDGLNFCVRPRPMML